MNLFSEQLDNDSIKIRKFKRLKSKCSQSNNFNPKTFTVIAELLKIEFLLSYAHKY